MTIKMRVMLTLAYAVLTIDYTAVSGNLNGRTFSLALTNLSTNVLGLQKMQSIIDKRAQVHSEKINGTGIVIKLAHALSMKFHAAFDAVNKIATTLEAEYKQGYVNNTDSMSCANVITSQMEYNFLFKKKINTRQPCHLVPDDGKVTHQIPTSTNLSKAFRDNFSRLEYIKWQYFGTQDGVWVMYPTQDMGKRGAYEPQLRSWYVETAMPQPKDIVIIFDRSKSMGTKRLRTAQEAAKTLIGTLNPSDRVGVVAFSDIVSTPPGCYSEELAFATDSNKDALYTYLDGVKATGGTNYVDALKTAFRLLGKSATSKTGETRQKVILFLTDGGAMKESDYILEQIADFNGNLNNEVVILTYGIGNDLGKTAKDLLSNMAKQTKFDPMKGNITRGTFTLVDNMEGLRLSLGSYYKQFSSPEQQNTPVVSAPFVDDSGLGVVISVCKPVFHKQKLQGVAAIDLRLADLLSSVTYYYSGEYSYVFIIDKSGRTLLHPLLPNPSTSDMTARAIVDISTLEPKASREGVISSMKSGKQGRMTLDITEVLSRGDPHLDGVKSVTVTATYDWRQIAGTSFCVCVVVPDDNRLVQSRGFVTAKKFVYHRLDLQPNKAPLCRIGKKLGTRQTPLMKLTGAAFLDPNLYFNRIENAETVQTYGHFVAGTPTSNPNLKPGVRQAAALTEFLDDTWKSSDYPYWRYLGNRHGVFKIYPGTVMPKNYDPTIRRWFLSAVAINGDLVLTPPYVDAFGTGIVLTLSKTLVQRRTGGTHSAKDKILGVMAVDMKLNTVKPLLSTLFPPCDDDDKSCFLVDKSGFIVYHEHFLPPHNDRVEHVHLTEKEEHIADDLIQNNFMTQKSCLGVNTKKKYNTWRIAIQNKIDNMGKPLAYSLEVVPGSNVYLGIKKEAPKMFAICHSCPVKTNGDVIECKLDNKHCHCPCFVTTGFKPCENIISEQSDNTDLCTPEAPKVTYSSPVKNESEWVTTLQPCFPTRCPDMTVKSECEDYVDCEWCESANDGSDISPCHKRGKCPRSHSAAPSPVYIAVGAAVGTVVVVALIVVAGIFCCRNLETVRVSKTDEYDNAPQVTVAPEVETLPEGDYEELTLPAEGDSAGDWGDNTGDTSVST